MNLKAISRNVGFALLVSALFMLLSVLVSVLNGNDSALTALLISFTITFTVGVFPFIFVTKAPSISLRDGYLIIVLSWLLSFIFGMLPYILWGGPFTVINAWYESVSGFTTTGSTILESVEDLPKSLLFWRASTHYIGGLGVVVFLLLIIPMSAPVKLRLSNMELSSLSKDGYKSRVNKTVSIFAYVYLGLTAASFGAYVLAGMDSFDAICHAFSVTATGGFSTKNLSIGAFDSTWINLITIFFMFIGGTHFGTVYMALINRSFKPVNNAVFRYYLISTVVCSLVVATSIKATGEMGWGKAMMDGTFHVVSYTTTTGFAISNTSNWPIFACVVLMWCSIQCGMAGSTTGGLKSDRVLLFFSAIGRQIKQSIHPSSVKNVKVGTHSIKDEEVYPHILFMALYGAMIALSTILCLAIGGSNSSDVFTSTITSIGNVGATVGEIGSMGNFNAQPSLAKLVYSFNMLLGRLEFYPVFAVIAMIFRKF